MKDDFYYIELFLIYKGLLTEKQREIFESHYCLDLSYAEIAEAEGGSRQSICDAIKIVKGKLADFEKTLNIREKNEEITLALKNCSDIKTADKIKEIIGK